MKIGFVGLGRMGRAMVSSLLRAGHEVVVYNRTRAAAEELQSRGARVAHSPAEAARGARLVATMLADDAAVESVALGTGAVAPEDAIVGGLDRGAVHVSMSTIAPVTAQALADAHRAAGQHYVAAPVLGRPDAAERGQLVVIAAGPEAALDACAPLFDAVGRKTHRLGRDVAQANAVKLGSNFVLASMIQAIGEAVALSEGWGVDAHAFLDVLNGSMLKSEVLGAYGTKIAERSFEPAGFRLSLGLKDVRLALAAGESAGAPMPLGAALRDRLAAAAERGLADCDWSAVARLGSDGRAAAR